MNTWQSKVHTFHEATGSTVGTEPAMRDRELRAKLITEEYAETMSAMGYGVDVYLGHEGLDQSISMHKEAKEDFLEYIDGMCDLIYVILGSAVAAGINLDPHFDEVHYANMTKLKGPKRADGKQLKPEGWVGPDHEKILIRQKAREDEWRQIEAQFLRASASADMEPAGERT